MTRIGAAQRVGRYQALGCSDFMLMAQPRDSVHGMVESLEWFAREVRPRVQEDTPAVGG